MKISTDNSFKAVFIPGHPGPFVTQLSEKLALFAPHLTLDFINEVAAGMDKTSVSQRINCLQYMGPWVKNLSLFVDPANRLFEHSATKFRDCIRVLIDLTLADHEVITKFPISVKKRLTWNHRSMQ